MFKKIIIGLVIFLGGTFIGYYILPPRKCDPIKHTIFSDWMSTYIDKDYGVAVQYLSRDKAHKLPDGSLSILGGGNTKPYIVRFQRVPQTTFQAWYNTKTWSGGERDYWFTTSTRNQPIVVSDITQTLYTMIRPGTLVTIENAKSSYGNYHSPKILVEMVFDMKPIRMKEDGFYEVEEIEE